MTKKHLFWDSCAFIAYLNDESEAYDTASLKAYISNLGKPNGCEIYTSAIALAEITPKKLITSKFGSFDEFLRDAKGAIHILDAGPNECQTAALLKDVEYQKSGNTGRVLTTGDALMLATAIELEDTYGVKIDAFHTYDRGNGPRGPEGKGIPLIGYETWLNGVVQSELVKRVVNMNRCNPIHPSPMLDI